MASARSAHQPVLVAVLAACAYAALLGVAGALPRYDDVVLAFVLGLVFRALDHASDRGRTLGLHLVTQALVAGFLVHLFHVGYEGRNAVFGGILPWSDSFDYYDDAQRLVHGERFTEFASKRPIFPATFALLLRVASLRFAVVVFAVVGAWATALAALEVWRAHGARAALVVFAILLFFERRWTGFIQTEHAGFPLGLVAFVLLLRASSLRDSDRAAARHHLGAALFAMTVGLMARAGAFFVLPALAYWGARHLALGRGEKLRVAALAVAAVVSGFLVHKTVLALTGHGVTFSDYPAIAYGLLHGKDYTYLAEAHPEIAQLPVAERVAAAWGALLSDARQDPSLVVSGLASSGIGLFTSPFGLFSYVWTNPDDIVLEDGAAVRSAMAEHGLLGPLVLWQRTLGTFSLVNAGAMGLLGIAFVASFAVGLVTLVRTRRRAPGLAVLRYAALGIVTSAPFTPPWITSGQQVQTVTLAFAAAIPAVACFGIGGDETQRTSARTTRRLVAVAPAYAALLVIATLVLRRVPAAVPPCAGAPTLAIDPTTEVEVVPSRTLSFRKKGRADLERSTVFLRKHNPELTSSLLPFLREGTVYAAAFDACDRRAKLIVDDVGALTAAQAGGFLPRRAAPLATPRVLHLAPVEP